MDIRTRLSSPVRHVGRGFGNERRYRIIDLESSNSPKLAKHGHSSAEWKRTQYSSGMKDSAAFSIPFIDSTVNQYVDTPLTRIDIIRFRLWLSWYTARRFRQNELKSSRHCALVGLRE